MKVLQHLFDGVNEVQLWEAQDLLHSGNPNGFHCYDVLFCASFFATYSPQEGSHVHVHDVCTLLFLIS